ncbi:MAG: T9SS type A sorting domain-containing protein [Chitinophagaceae bacterium]|nr:MAG: T9SS type A sorting domain-containing protein [Chitinophagaceae bacterium]
MRKLTGFTLWAIFFLLPQANKAQGVTEIITDFGGYWQSKTTAISPIKPDNSHNLLAFTLNGVRYSTGVNNGLLSSYGLTYIPAEFRALGVSGISGTITSNTKVALGALFDGIFNGPSLVAPGAGISQYLTDGVNGLNLGTGVANLPVGQLEFSVNNLLPAAIGDGVPDILVTQIADPSGTADSYQFVDATGATVGHSVSISFSTTPAVANWTADFYEASIIPMILNLGFTQTDRPLRLWAADLSDFGIHAGNYSSIARFRINLAGNSDVAFVAYNNTTVSLLPVTLSFFEAQVSNKDIKLNWQTVSEKEMDSYEVQAGNGTEFTTIGTVPAMNGSTNDYRFTHLNGAFSNTYYRLKQNAQNGSFSYSKVVKLAGSKANAVLQVFPNPCRDYLKILHPPSTDGRLQLSNISGVKLLEKKPAKAQSLSDLDLSGYPSGIYLLQWLNEKDKQQQFIIKQ